MWLLELYSLEMFQNKLSETLEQDFQIKFLI